MFTSPFRKGILLLAAVVAASLFPALTPAQTVVNDNWLGGTGLWSNPANWSAGVVPNNSSDGTTVYAVTIDSGKTDVVELELYDAFKIASLVVGGLTGSSVIEYPTGNPYSAYAFIEITGSLTVNKKGKLERVGQYGGCNLMVDGNVVVAGTISATGGAQLCLNNGGFGVGTNTVTNSGSISVGSDAVLEANSITNSGNLTLSGHGRGYISSGITQTKGKILVDGEAELIVAVDGGDGAIGVIAVSGGTIEGAGTLFGKVNLMGGATITPQSAKKTTPPGRGSPYGMVVEADYTQSETSGLTLKINLANGPPPPAWLRVESANATISGNLTVTFNGGNIPPVGYSIVVLEDPNDGVTGTFTNMNLPALPNGETWSVNYTGYSLVLTVTAPN